MHIDYCAQSETQSLQRQLSNPSHAALAEQYADVDRRIARIENGIERPDGMPLSALKLRRRLARPKMDAATAASSAEPVNRTSLALSEAIPGAVLTNCDGNAGIALRVSLR